MNVNSNKKTARILGVLFLIQLVTYWLGSQSLLVPILSTPNYLVDISANTNNVIIAMLLELMSGTAFVGFAVILFPILKKYDKNVALAYLGLRFIGSRLLL